MDGDSFITGDGIGCRCVTVHGDVDLSNAKELARTMAEAALAGPVVVDLSACTYIDSTGLAVFVKHERNHRGNLVIVAPASQRSLRIFEITGLALTLTMTADLDEAFALYESRRISA